MESGEKKKKTVEDSEALDNVTSLGERRLAPWMPACLCGAECPCQPTSDNELSKNFLCVKSLKLWDALL